MASNVRREPRSIFITAADGLKLHVRSYGSDLASSVPVVCLPGMTRTTADFDELAQALSSHPQIPRRVFALDYRGRGLSDYDPDPLNYNLATELADVEAVLNALGLPPAVFIGTSRGGILTMLLASIRPAAIAGAVLNDIGPVIEPAGLMRIKGYVGRMPRPASFEEAAEILCGLFGSQFPRLTGQDWLVAARNSFKVEGGHLVPTYDERLAATLDGVDIQHPPPPLWTAFGALAGMPLMVLRGANSDLLTEQILAAMQARHPGMISIVVPDQGHPPILAGAELIDRIVAFVANCQAALPH